MAYNRTTKTITGAARRLMLVKATSAMALATGLATGASSAAYAQAFEGNPTVVSGGANVVRSPGTDTIQVDTDQAVINWTTNDTAVTGGPINFLPTGRTAFFRNNPSAQNFFTVLNRIIPNGTSRAIQFNGSIISQLQTAAGLVPGGNVWFYSPGGIVVNSTAVIDVGGLLLTSSDPVRDGNGSFITGNSFTLGPSASASSVIVQPGAQISATAENSYIAMVAPTVFQAGNVNVNGSALYVGAEAATITFGGNGLFDIQVTTGTDGTGGIGVGHSGVTTGPASGGSTDNHRIYMVAVPKNNAITLALSGGSLGFDVAGAVDVIGNSIILSGGYNVFGDTVDNTPVNPGQQANISISSGTITSAINAEASFNTNVSVGSGTLALASNARFYGNNQSTVTAFGTGTILVDGDLTVSSDRVGLGEGENVTGGNAQLYAQAGGAIFVNGNAFVSANAIGGSSSTSGAVGSGTGGIADVRSFGDSVLSIGGDLVVSADGFAGGSDGGSASNAGIGGTVIILSGRNASVDNNSTMLVNGNMLVTANGFGSSNFGSGVAGLGRGGSIQIESGSGTGLFSSNNVLTVNGSILSNADGFGGLAFNDGVGGVGIGGTNSINAGVGGRINVAGPVSLTSFGFGGNADDGNGNGGAGTGGNASVQIFGSGGVLNFGSNLLLQASGIGGMSGSSATSLGGLGTGGLAQIALSSVQTGGAITVQGETQIDAQGLGGQGVTGGDGSGGRLASGGGALIAANGAGNITLNGRVLMSSGGVGGAATQSGIGGSGSGAGGTTQIVASGAGTNIDITGLVAINANGAVFSSSLTGIDGGNGTGGNASISQTGGGAISITGDVIVQATGTGDANSGGGDGIAGNGVGGDARIAVNDRFITITGNADVDASGRGGESLGGIRGGDGIGGLANLGAGAGTLAIGGQGFARADGTGGSSVGSGSGGDGLGGLAVIGAIPGGIIQIAGAAIASAQGFGGDASGAGSTGGLGDGGTSQLFADNTGSVSVGGITLLNASAFGGSASSGANSGEALGGFVSLLSLGNGQIALNQDTFLSAQGLSGNVDDGAGNAAAATGGVINVIASGAGSNITVTGSLLADAIAGGGSAVTGTIGNALGGTVELQAASGTLAVTGSVSLDATAFGGASTLTGNGGNATGGRTALVVAGAGNGTVNIGSDVTMTSGAFGGSAQTGNGGAGTGGLSELGTINVAGTFNFGGPISMNANGDGGDALLAGNGGAATGGTSRFGSNNSQIIGGDVFISAVARGGNGALGGAGGQATGGFSLLLSDNGVFANLIDLDNVFMFADAIGGAGGAGANGTVGGAGGAGGNAIGGAVQAFGAAGNGVLDIGNLQISSNGIGGIGGAGGIGSAGLGGLGGAGGNAVGGFNQFGTISSTGALTVNNGAARMLDAFAQATGFAGAGGNGGAGSTGAGNGGAGGVGEGGGNVLLVRGSRVTLNTATLVSDGFGGSGGLGALLGAGGNGIGGGVAFAITDRFMVPTQRGLLEAGSLQGIAGGVGGFGSVQGLSLYGTGSNFEIRNADANIGDLTITLVGDAPNPTGIVEDFIRITDGVANIANGFTFTTPGQLSVLVNNGALNTGTLSLSAGTFVADTVITAPGNIGTISANAIDIFSSNDIIVTANLSTFGDASVSAGGLVELGDIDAGGVISVSGGGLNLGNLFSGNHINLFGGSVSTGAISAANFVEIFASGGIFTSDIDAGAYIFALSDGGDISTGNLTAGGFIGVETAAGNIAVGNVTAGEDAYLDAIGSISFGNVSTGLNFDAIADGDILGGNIVAQSALAEADYGVGLAASGNIQVGSIQSARNIGALSLGTFTSGGLSTSENVILLVDGNIQINGGITTGTGANRFFYIGNSSMSSLLDSGGGNDNTSFIGGAPDPVFAVSPVRTLGSLTVNGPIETGNFVVGLGTGFTVNGPITATNGRIAITANSISAQNLVSTLNTSLNATNGNIVVGSVTAGGAVGLLAGAGQITSGVLTGASVAVDGQGAVSIGGVTTTGAAQLRSMAGTFSSIGAITGGTVNIGGTALALANVTSTAGAIAMAASAGNLSFGTLTSSANTQFSATGSVSGGDITAGSWIGTTVGGDMTLGNLRTTGPGTSANGFSIGLGAQGNIVTGTIGSFGLLGIGSDDGQGNLGNAASITTGAITAGGSAFLRSTQGLATGAITSTNEIRVRGGTVTTGALQATNGILAAAMTGNLNTGNITTGASAVLLAAQSVSTGAISTGTTGTTLIANSSAISPTGLISTIDLNALLATTPVRVGGSVSIGAPVTTGTLLSASTGGFSASNAIVAGTRISLDVGGTAVFGGLAVAPTIAISSADIAFSQAGGLGNANTGTLTLTANRNAVVIGGDAQDPEQVQIGYRLDGSEISRIRAQNIVINAPNVSSSSTGVEIRALTMNGSGAASGINLNGSEGSLTINTGGTIRVNGNAVFNSMASTNRVALNARRVEINADTGGIFLNGSSPGGVLSITADNIHIAGAELLGRLAENVNFTGRDAALGLPIATSRPDGVIQASRLQFNVGSTLLIQNTGTSLLNAGFFGRVGSVEINPVEGQSSQGGLIDMVIYGQLLDSGDIVRNGSSVRDLIFPRSTSAGQDSSGPSGFTANSSVNGCLLNAISCGSGGVTQESPTVVTHAGPPPPRPAEERQAEREQEEAEAAAEEAARGEAAPRRPIMPPVTIVNSRNLSVEPIIAEPVTSGGNPNLQLDQPLPTPLPDTGGQP